MYLKIKSIFKSIGRASAISIVAVFISFTTNAQVKKEVIILNNSLYVFPEDIGYYTYSEAKEACETINLSKSYGFSDWRLPTLFELQVMCLSKVEGIEKDVYIHSSNDENSAIKGNVRLVRADNNTKTIRYVNENVHNPFWFSQIMKIVSSSAIRK